MKYTILDEDNIVTEIKNYTQEEYDALSAVDRADLYLVDEITYPLVKIGYVYQSHGVYVPAEYADEQLFNEDIPAYIENICKEVDALLIARFDVGFMYNGKPYKADMKSQLWANAYLQAIQNGSMTDVVNWISIDNTVTQFAVADYATFCGYFLNWAQGITFETFGAKAQIRATTDYATVRAIYTALAAKNDAPDPQS